mmetsp:Transcript_18983/g.25016  ORF Transcript_18983/g.25016 Transcript_18983/m.25016 type:complete len:402 (+) Transcript_18983:71-1276(+)
MHHQSKGYHGNRRFNNNTHVAGESSNGADYPSPSQRSRSEQYKRCQRPNLKDSWGRRNNRNEYSKYGAVNSYSRFPRRGRDRSERFLSERKIRDRSDFRDDMCYKRNANHYGPLKKDRRSNRRSFVNGFSTVRSPRRRYQREWWAESHPQDSHRNRRRGGNGGTWGSNDRSRSGSPVSPTNGGFHRPLPRELEGPPPPPPQVPEIYVVEGHPQEYAVVPRHSTDDWPRILAEDHSSVGAPRDHGTPDRNPYNPEWVSRERSMERTYTPRLECPGRPWQRWYSPHSPAGPPLSPASPLEPLHLMQHQAALAAQQQQQVLGEGGAPRTSPVPELEFGLGVSIRGFAKLRVCSSVATDDSERDHVETCTIASTDVHPPSSVGNASEHDGTLSPPLSPNSLRGFS